LEEIFSHIFEIGKTKYSGLASLKFEAIASLQNAKIPR